MSSCFKITHQSKNSLARTGILTTAHNKLETPFYMPVATKGAVKNINHIQLQDLDFNCLISNAFINYLRPGLDLISKAGGLHKFSGWNNSYFTDSGGFQLILDHFNPVINDEGVSLKNPFTSKKEMITPEKSIEIQNILGSDVAMCLDHQPVFGKDRKDYLESTIRTIEWAKRCIDFHKSNSNKLNSKQLLFGIVQGGNHIDLRQMCALALTKLDFDGVALGGFGIGEAQKDMYNIIYQTKKYLLIDNPTYIMGIGSPIEILNCVENGADCFDSVYPMRMARHGLIFTANGEIKIDRGAYKEDFSPLDKECDCFVCKNHSRAYLHHLYKTHEQNAHVLLTYHNVYFVQNLIKNIRLSIKEDNFLKFKKEFEKKYKK
ncbi:MAG: tRNA guanosine(34) transglycosylase Tgt [Candidatus ainarchaeum sp.]|nr:tRNA guanosine(34) transglycosylase Tgt [Candidatus ainarchaeum sp.]